MCLDWWSCFTFSVLKCGIKWVGHGRIYVLTNLSILIILHNKKKWPSFLFCVNHLAASKCVFRSVWLFHFWRQTQQKTNEQTKHLCTVTLWTLLNELWNTPTHTHRNTRKHTHNGPLNLRHKRLKPFECRSACAAIQSVYLANSISWPHVLRQTHIFSLLCRQSHHQLWRLSSQISNTRISQNWG